MFQGKYIAIAISLLFLFSAMPLMASAASSSAILTGAQVSTHGPLINTVDFTNIGSDSTLYTSLAAGTIQVAEWTFSTGSYLTSQSNTALTSNATLTYATDGIAFNMLHAVINDTHFRTAILDLTNYTAIQSTALSGIAGVAGPAFLPCALYPTACNPSAYSSVNPNGDLAAAVTQLLDAGLSCGGCTPSTASSSTVWTYGPTYGSLSGKPFSPLFDYRVDDPLRTGGATLLVHSASEIGLTLNAKGITDSAAGGLIYGSSEPAVISGGAYDPTTGGDTPPTYNFTYANSGANAWDMYTYGWIDSPPFSVAWYFFNSVSTIDDFGNYYNQTMDVATNTLFYASNLTAAGTAAKSVDTVLAQQNPYVVWFYTNQLWSVYTNGFAGYVNFGGYGPDQSTGIYYTLLNLHQTGGSGAPGGTATFALHAAPDKTGLDPLYHTNWLWQADLWSEVYDSLVAQSPLQPTTPLAYIPWAANYAVDSYTGSTGTGAGWSYLQPTVATTTAKIVNGQKMVFNLYDNMTFSDNTLVTAYDINASLFYTNDAGTYATNNSPYSYSSSGSSGLIADYINPSNPFQITLYYNSSAVWNIANVITVIMPAHILDYFNASSISTTSTALDTTQTFATAATACGCLNAGVTTSSAPLWLQDELNLEVGSGPFYLSTFNPSTGSGALQRNVNYYRSAWYAGAPSVQQGTSDSFSTNIAENFFNAGSLPLGGVAAGASGSYAITNATGTVTLMQSGAKVGSAIPLTGGTGGTYSASIPTASLSPGLYEVEVNATYNFLGLARTWFQFEGLQVTAPPVTTTTAPPVTTTTAPPVTTTTAPPVTTTTAPPTTTTSTTSSTDYTPYILGGVVVVIIVIIAIALATRRRGTGGGT